jgi:hypothetical protein
MQSSSAPQVVNSLNSLNSPTRGQRYLDLARAFTKHRTVTTFGDNGTHMTEVLVESSSPSIEKILTPPVRHRAIAPRVSERSERSELSSGLCVAWARGSGWLALTDPFSGEVHEIRSSDAPRWMVRRAMEDKPVWAPRKAA